MKSSMSAACEDLNHLCIQDGFRTSEQSWSSLMSWCVIRPARTKGWNRNPASVSQHTSPAVALRETDQINNGRIIQTIRRHLREMHTPDLRRDEESRRSQQNTIISSIKATNVELWGWTDAWNTENIVKHLNLHEQFCFNDFLVMILQ